MAVIPINPPATPFIRLPSKSSSLAKLTKLLCRLAAGLCSSVALLLILNLSLEDSLAS